MRRSTCTTNAPDVDALRMALALHSCAQVGELLQRDNVPVGTALKFVDKDDGTVSIAQFRRGDDVLKLMSADLLATVNAIVATAEGKKAEQAIALAQEDRDLLIGGSACAWSPQ